MYSRRASDYSSHMSSYGDERESPDKTIVEEEEESAGNGQPQPPTEMFKGQDISRSDTPETYLTDLGDKPDITLFCEQCKYFIDIRQLKHHRAYHNALLLIGYKPNSWPESVEHLLKKRNSTLRKLKKETTDEKPLMLKHVQEVNDAYELLKSDLEDTFEECRQVRESVDTSCQGTALSCSLECVYALGMCSSPNARWKKDMEDTKVYQDCFGENSKMCYMGLFDGYHGRFSAEVAASLLHKMLLHEMIKFDSSLMMAPKQSYDAENDISHHTFVFGADASLDCQKSGKGQRDQNTKTDKDVDYNAAPVSIQPDDDELTQRIIELCEHKYEKLLEEMSPLPSAKSGRSNEGKTDRSRHPQETKIFDAFEKSYQLLDILLSYGKDECSNVRWSGCSALSLVIESVQQSQAGGATGCTSTRDDNKSRAHSRHPEQPQTKGFIHLANAGGTQALLVRGNRPYKLSKDHTPNNVKERERVIRQGGTLSSSEVDCRVNGVLATTRGLGNHGDPSLKKCVLVEPHTCSVPIDQYAQFIVMASSGVWEVLSDTEVTSLMMRMLPTNQIPPPSHPSSSLAVLLNEGVNNSPSPGSPAASVRTAVTDKGKDGDSNEKGTADAEVSEKAASEAEVEGRKIHADLMTEAGSHFGDTEEPGDRDLLTLPVHSNVWAEGSRGTEQERRRELARLMSEHLVQAALLAGSRNNITVMVVLLPGCRI